MTRFTIQRTIIEELINHL